MKRLLLRSMVLTVVASLAQVRESTFKHWKSYELKNRFITLHITPQLGGRIISYSLGGHNFLWSNDTLAGRNVSPSGLASDGSWLNWGGDKLWPAPQGWGGPDQWPGPPDAALDGRPHAIEILRRATGEAAVELTSPNDERSGIQLSRVVELDEDGTHLGVTATMTNVDRKPRRWGIWTVTQLNAESALADAEWNMRFRTYAPLTSNFQVLYGAHDNPEFQVDRGNKLLRVHYQRKVGKIGLYSTGGWLANVDGTTGYVFVQEFTHQPRRPVSRRCNNRGMDARPGDNPSVGSRGEDEGRSERKP